MKSKNFVMFGNMIGIEKKRILAENSMLKLIQDGWWGGIEKIRMKRRVRKKNEVNKEREWERERKKKSKQK